MSTIRLREVLNKWDKIEKGNKDQTFSIGFITKKGEARYFKRAVKTGCPFNLSDNKMRACLPVDDEGNSIGHITPFSIWLITQFNGKNVIL